MKNRKKVMLAVLIGAACAVTATGCGKVDGSAAAMTINDEKVSVGTANFLLRYEEAQTNYMMTSWGLATAGNMWDTVTDEETGETYGDSFKEGEAEDLENMVVLRQNAEDYKVELTDDELAEIETVAQTTYDNNKEAMDQMGSTKDNIAEILQLKTLEVKMRNAMQEDTDREVSDEEAMQTKVSYCRKALSTTDDDGNSVDLTEEEIEAGKKDLESKLAELKAAAGSETVDFSEVIDTENESGLYCSTLTYDTNPAEDAEDDGVDQEIKDAVAGLNNGQFCDKVIQTDNYLYIVRLDTTNDEEATASKKETIISEREQENYQKKLDAMKEESTITIEKGWEDLKVTDKDTYSIAVAETEETEDAEATEEVEVTEEAEEE